MRKVTVLLAVLAVAALASAPAHGWTFNTFKGGSIAAGEGDYHTAADWGMWNSDIPGWSGAGTIPGTGDSVRIRGDSTCHIWDDVTNGNFQVGYIAAQPQYNGGYGNVIVESEPGEPYYAPVIDTGFIWLGTVTWWHDGVGGTYERSTWTHTCGSLTTGELAVGVWQVNVGPTGYPDDNGYAKFVISGGTLTEDTFGIYVGWRDADSPSNEGKGKSIFRIEGDDATINARRYLQNYRSTLEVVLTSSGTVTPINCSPVNSLYKNTVVNGMLDLDASANTPTVGDRITILEILNGLEADKRDDLLDYADLALSAPAGWGLIDNGLGALSVKFTLGDVTESGYVDGSDLDEVLAKWGTTQVLDDVNPRWLGDVTCDETVDGSDLDYVLAAWGQGTPPPVPEPITLTLLGFGGLALLRRRRS